MREEVGGARGTDEDEIKSERRRARAFSVPLKLIVKG